MFWRVLVLQGFSTYVSDLLLYSQESLNSLRSDQAKLSNPVSVEVLPELQYELEQLLKMYDQSRVEVEELQRQQHKDKAALQASVAAANGSGAPSAALQAECK